MPIVHVNFWEGVGEKQIKKMIRGITDVIADTGVPEHIGVSVVNQLQKY